MLNRLKFIQADVSSDAAKGEITINAKDSLEWLRNRRLFGRRVMKQIKSIESLVAQALPGSSGLEYEGPFHYFHALAALERYPTDEWKKICTVYTVSNAHLAEAAQLLSQLFTYDLPLLNDQVLELQKKIEIGVNELKERKREVAHIKRQMSARWKKLTTSDAMSVDIDESIENYLSSMGQVVNEVSEMLSSVSPCLEMYKRQTLELHSASGELLPTLAFIIKHGNVTVDDELNIFSPDEIELVMGADGTFRPSHVTLLRSPVLRRRLERELLELQSFMSGKLSDLESGQSFYTKDSLPDVKKHNSSLVRAMGEMSSSRMSEFIQLSESSTFRQRIAGEFKSMQAAVQVLENRSMETEKSNNMYAKEILTLEQEIEAKKRWSLKLCHDLSQVVSSLLKKNIVIS